MDQLIRCTLNILKYINMLKIPVMIVIFILTRFPDSKIQEKHD